MCYLDAVGQEIGMKINYRMKILYLWLNIIVINYMIK